MCGACGAAMVEGSGEFSDLCGPSTTITEIPALVCVDCGAGRFSKHVLKRLFVILEEALDVADDVGVRSLVWSYTPSGPPEMGALPAHVRDSFAGLRELLAQERLLVKAAGRAVRGACARALTRLGFFW